MNTSLSRTRALVVDDSPTQAIEIRHRLVAAGFAVRIAVNGRAALAALEQELPEIVLTDLQMPEMDGLELVQQLTRCYPGLPVILLTAFGSEEIAVRALRGGAAGYVSKKNLNRDLARTLENVLTLVRASRGRRHLTESMIATESTFVFPNDLTLVAPLIARLQANLARLRLCDETQLMRVGLALREALVNAVEHGNLEVDSELKENDDGGFERLRAERRGQEPYASRKVYFTASETGERATYVIRDEGPGFNPAILPDPSDPANLTRASGRGLALVHAFMDAVSHNEPGNEITMTKCRSGSLTTEPGR